MPIITEGPWLKSNRKIGAAQQRMQNWDGARKAFEIARTQLEYLLAHGSQIPTLQFDLATVCFQLGADLQRVNRLPEALAVTEEAAKQYRVLLARSPENEAVRKNLSSVLGNRAIFLRLLKRLPEALGSTAERSQLWPEHAANLYDAAADFARTYNLAVQIKADDEICRQARHYAIQTLAESVRAGLVDRKPIRNDPLFAALRQTEEFQAFLKSLQE